VKIAAIKKFCAALPGARAEIKWQVDLVYVVGGKMFCVLFEGVAGNSTLSFKVDDDLFLQYTDRPGFIPAPYMARAKWVQLTDFNAVSDAELKALIVRSHQLVANKLSKKLRSELGLG
jgi:predicted DNA-binding protein (MmcQ/YjbR family)